MRVLVLGGTAFLGAAVAAEAVRRGHDVVCAARGESGPVPQGAGLVRVDRNAPDGLAPLRGQRFDAVVDVATISQPWVAEALRVLGAGARHWTFVSSVNVYRDTATVGQRPDAPVLEPRDGQIDVGNGSVDPQAYGQIKVASENTVRDAMGDRAFVVRPGLITGPGDVTDRFGYWPARMSQGGRVLVPDVPDQQTQYIDVRDLAAWIVDAGEQDITGTYDGVGPPRPLPDLLRDIASVLNSDLELVAASAESLTRANVRPWAGPRSLPLLVPPGYSGFCSHDAAGSLDAGLRIRSLADTVAGALDRERELGLDRKRRAGLTRTEEATALALL